jgi:predicted thioesterase
MESKLEIGIKGQGSVTVDESLTARALDSGDLPVFATPAMIALMEKTAAESVRAYLAPESTSVGTLVNIEHVSATLAGGVVRCESELIGIEGRKLRFTVAAYDEAGVIGRGVHERFVVDRVKFMEKAAKKGR